MVSYSQSPVLFLNELLQNKNEYSSNNLKKNDFEIPDQAKFGIRYQNVKEFVKIMTAAKILNLCNCHGSKEGLFIRGLTDDHITYCDVTLKKEIFQNLFFKEILDVDGKNISSITFGLKMDTFCKYLSKLASMEYVDVFLIGTDILRLSTQNVSYDIRLLDIQEQALNVILDDVSCFIQLSIDTQIFSNAINSLSKIGENIQFNFLKNHRLNLCSSDITCSGNINITDQPGSGLYFHKFQESSFTYDFKIIETIFKYNFSNSIDLMFNNEGVLKCKHFLYPQGYIIFLVASRIQD